MTKQASRLSAANSQRRKRYARLSVGCFLSVVCAFFFFVASVPELRELRCRSDVSPTMTCQLTYQSLTITEIETVEGVKSVEIRQKRQSDRNIGLLMLSPNEIVVLITNDGPYTLKAYDSGSKNAVFEDELKQLRDRLLTLEQSPSEGLSMSFSRKIWHDLKILWFWLCGMFLLFLIAVMTPALLLFSISCTGICTVTSVVIKKKSSVSIVPLHSPTSLFLRPSHRRWFTRIYRLKRFLNRCRYIFPAYVAMFLTYIVWPDVELVLVVSAVFTGFFYGLFVSIAPHLWGIVNADSLLSLAVFSKQLHVLSGLSKSAYLEATELGDWERQQALSLEIHHIVVAIAKQEPLLITDLLETLHTVLQLNSRFFKIFDTARLMKILSYPWMRSPTALPYQEISQHRFLERNQRLVQIRQRLSQTQRYLQTLSDQLLARENTLDTLPIVDSYSKQLQELVETNRRVSLS